MGLQLDTSGFVGPYPAPLPVISGVPMSCIAWSDLNPFTQEYVEALPWDELARRARSLFGDQAGWTPPGFSDLAPETLARIMEDCARFQNIASGLGVKTGAHGGRHFWAGRQRGMPGAPTFAAAFPPLTPYLGDDGKVRFRDVAA